MTKRPIYQHDKPAHRPPRWPLYGLAVVVIVALALGYWQRQSHHNIALIPGTTPRPAKATGTHAGDILGVDSVQYFSPTAAETVSKQNYGSAAPAITTGVDKITFHYQSTDLGGQPITIYARAYLPDNPSTNLPIFAFAPGTTGVGEQCAASLEVVTPATSYGNYDSHMITYASQGYAGVITDYEGFRDPGHIHHYMVGALEGRAVLDSIRALEHLSQSQGRLDTSNIFVGGYSQGGHAAFWADTINSSYAPEIKLKGVVGFGPVLSVEATMNDVAANSILDWFGPYVLASYSDYYHENYGINTILQPAFGNNLYAQVTSHCVDTAYTFWGHEASKVYTPEYLNSIRNGTFATQYPALAQDLQANATGTEPTATAKLINQGHYDVVVLPSQAQTALPTMCQQSKGPVALKIYPSATHFNTMVVSLHDTLTWLEQLRTGVTPASTCPLP